MPHTGIANLEFYRLETDKAQPSLSCSRNSLFAAPSVVLLVSSGLSSLISRIWARDRGLTIGSIDLGVLVMFRLGYLAFSPFFRVFAMHSMLRDPVGQFLFLTLV